MMLSWLLPAFVVILAVVAGLYLNLKMKYLWYQEEYVLVYREIDLIPCEGSSEEEKNLYIYYFDLYEEEKTGNSTITCWNQVISTCGEKPYYDFNQVYVGWYGANAKNDDICRPNLVRKNRFFELDKRFIIVAAILMFIFGYITGWRYRNQINDVIRNIYTE